MYIKVQEDKNLSDYESVIIRKSIRVYGAVQGVGFRYRAVHAAQRMGVTGWVKNEPDGSVSMEVQGTEEQIDKVFLMISTGTYVNIERMQASKISVLTSDYGFECRD